MPIISSISRCERRDTESIDFRLLEPSTILRLKRDKSRLVSFGLLVRTFTERTEGTRQFVLMEAALAKAEAKRAEWESKATELQVTNNEQAGQIKLLQAQAEQFKQEIRQLYQEIANLKANGKGD